MDEGNTGAFLFIFLKCPCYSNLGSWDEQASPSSLQQLVPNMGLNSLKNLREELTNKRLELAAKQ